MSTPSLDIFQRLARYKPTELGADLSHLTPNDRLAIKKLAQMADILNNLYFEQAWKGNLELKRTLENKAKASEEDKATLEFFKISKGPWDSAEHNEIFVKGAPPKPPGANVYPEDMTKEEFDAWYKDLSSDDKKKAHGFYHIVKRNDNGKLALQAYNEAYKEFLEPAHKLMKEAADLVEDPSFKKFLSSRADSFLSNEYVDSEIDWLKIKPESPIEAAIGPYEVYTDELYGAKAFFEVFLHARDFESTAMLDKFSSSLEFIENRLPIPDEYKNTDLTPPPIVVVNQLYSGGDASVPMTAAYNLPNDEEAIKRGGSKLTLIKNVQHGKFNSVLGSISKVVIDDDQLQYISFDAFFNHTLLHEVSHSNGPHHVVNQPDVTVRSKLQDLHSAFEEAKAGKLIFLYLYTIVDITALFACPLLVDNGVIDSISLEQIYVTYLASAFRSIRFGLNEAHGQGQAIQLNYLIDEGGFEYNESTGKFRVNFEKIVNGVSSLTNKIMLFQGNGDKAGAAEFSKKYGINRDYTKKALDKLLNVPVDIRPIYTAIEEL
ncbi:hypothetical protein H4219_003222 [Mycoemilia scoparia]|uniref:Nudix hydrolase 3 n=1 Tax=Mycoemilia scoparia TaxID=417184 RepID=A0A9W7ZVE2_9FUNG|nr:hypothetical protein H4219_003222 [Mycoemilia scoparia]